MTEFLLSDTLIYAGFAIVFVVGSILGYFVISLIGGS
jgi:hypothetical protein